MRSNLASSSLYSIGLAVLWIVLALANDGTTYHFASLLVAIAVPGGLALSDEGTTRQTALMATAVGFSLALGVTAALAVADALTGPSLLPFGGAVTESVLFAVSGAAVGVALGSTRIRTWR